MFRCAYEIAGLKISNEQFTKSEFNIIKNNEDIEQFLKLRKEVLLYK